MAKDTKKVAYDSGKAAGTAAAKRHKGLRDKELAREVAEAVLRSAPGDAEAQAFRRGYRDGLASSEDTTSN